MRAIRALSGATFAALVVLACNAGFENDDVDVVDPSNPTVHVTVTKDVVGLCDVMCSALIADYGVPPDQQDACVFQCADGFAATPDACYELVSCVHDANICANGDVSPDCRARAGPCLAHWAIPNGLCLGCWKPNADFVGTRAIRDTLPSGTNDVPVDLHALSVSAQLPTPTGFVTFPGTGTADGQFTIPGVPACPTWIQLGTGFFWATTTTPAFVDEKIGRLDAATAGPGTQLVLDITGYDDTAATYLELDVPNFSSQPGSLVPVGIGTLGSTSGSKTVDWAGNTIIDYGKGDVLWALQFSHDLPTSTPNLFYRHVQSIAKAPAFSMISGQTTHAQIALAPVAATQSARFDYRLETFYAELPDAQTSKLPIGDEYFFFVDTSYSGGNGGVTANLVDLPSLRGQVATLAPLDFVFPTFGPGYDVYADAFLELPRPMSADGAQTTVTDFVLVHGLVTSMTNGPIVPAVGTIRDLRVNGTPVKPVVDGDPAAVSASGFGLTPTVTWQPPDVGAVAIYKVTLTSIATTPKSVELDTTEPSVRVPPGVLTAGAAYTIAVQANGVPAPSGRSGITVVNSGVIRP